MQRSLSVDPPRLGETVWARVSGIRFSRGVVERPPAPSSKWVLVALESGKKAGGAVAAVGESKWVTVADLVPDVATEIDEDAQVIAAFEGDRLLPRHRDVGVGGGWLDTLPRG